MKEKMKMRFQKFLRTMFVVPFMLGVYVIPAYASSGETTTGTLKDTLSTFSDVFAWFLLEGGNLLSWMLDKPIILLSLAIFFVGSVVGVLSRIYNSF